MYLEHRIKEQALLNAVLWGMLMSVIRLGARTFSSICLLASLAPCKPSWEWEQKVIAVSRRKDASC